MARVVELGCGDGGNLLAIAAARPRAELVGFDAVSEALARGRELAGEAGLERVQLHSADLRDVRASTVGEADYVVVHGLWSWVTDEVREAVLALAAGIAPRGVVSLSYNALPGWHLWAAPRRDRAARGRGRRDPARAAAAAVAALEEAVDLHGRDDAYGRVLITAAKRLRERPPEVVFHDDLAEECTPFSLRQVAARATVHGLRYLGEALPEHWWAWRVAAPPAARVRSAGADPLDRQHAADLASGVDFKASLFVPDAARPMAEVEPAAALDLALRVRHDGPPMPDGTAPALRAMLEAVRLSASGALFRTVRDAAAAASVSDGIAAGAALRLVADGHAALTASAPQAVAVAGERPRAPTLARAQARRGARVASLLHEAVTLDDPGAGALLELLDGSKERAELPVALMRAADAQGFEIKTADVPAAVDAALARFGEVGLLEA